MRPPRASHESHLSPDGNPALPFLTFFFPFHPFFFFCNTGSQAAKQTEMGGPEMRSAARWVGLSPTHPRPVIKSRATRACRCLVGEGGGGGGGEVRARWVRDPSAGRCPRPGWWTTPAPVARQREGPWAQLTTFPRTAGAADGGLGFALTAVGCVCVCVCFVSRSSVSLSRRLACG